MSLLAALAFLTVLPVPSRLGLRPEHLAHSSRWFPLVGLGLGLFLAGSDALLGLVLQEPARNALLVLLGVALSGALHLDGLMDTCDALFAPVSLERRLEIMRDSHVGSFGVAGAGLVLLGKYAALGSLEQTPRAAALIATAVLSRWAMSLAVVTFSAARQDGLGRMAKQGARWPDLLLAGGTAVVVCGALLEVAGLVLFAAISLLILLAANQIAARISGLTGDSYGALNEVAELAVLALAPLCFRAFF